jgi:uncharacterized membrane protein
MNGDWFLALACGIGIVAGLRSLTAPAVVAWAAHLGWLNLQGSSVAFMGSTAAVAIFSLLAIGEWLADRVPGVPRRTAIAPLVARVCTAALCGACLAAAAHQSLLPACLLASVGAVIGAFAGYEIRRRLVSQLRLKDFIVAICEDLIALGLACLIVSR